jgi:TonB family protein
MTRRLSASWIVIVAALTFCLLPGRAVAQDVAGTKKLDLMLKPTAERLQSGAHGNMVLTGDLDASGAMTGMAIAKSSGSAAFDAELLASFEGNRLSAKSLTPGLTRIELSLTVQNFELKDGKTIVYPCDQVVRDIDWSRSSRTEWDVEQEYLFGIFRMLDIIIDTPRLKFVKDEKAYREAWLTAIEACRHNPGAFFTPLLVAAGNGGKTE